MSDDSYVKAAQLNAAVCQQDAAGEQFALAQDQRRPFFLLQAKVESVPGRGWIATSERVPAVIGSGDTPHAASVAFDTAWHHPHGVATKTDL